MRLLLREVRRQLFSIRIGVLIVAVAGFFLYEIVRLASHGSLVYGDVVGAPGAISRIGTGSGVGLLWTVVAGVFAGFGYVEDRALGRTPYVLARGVSRRKHLLTRMLGAVLAPAVATLVTGLAATAASFALLPARPFRVDGAYSASMSPSAALFQQAPVLNDVLWCLLTAVVITALGCLAGAVGALVPSRLLVMVTPFAFVMGLVFFAPSFLRTALDVVSFTGNSRSAQWQPALLGWGLLTAAVLLIVDQISWRRELL